MITFKLDCIFPVLFVLWVNAAHRLSYIWYLVIVVTNFTNFTVCQGVYSLEEKKVAQK